MYHSLWKFISIHELGYIILANMISFFMQIAGFHLLQYPIPRSYFFAEILLQTVMVVVNTNFLSVLPILERGKRTAFWLWPASEKSYDYWSRGCRGVIIKEILDSSFLTMKVCCVIDDDYNKTGRYISGIPIVGDRFAILKNVEKYKIDKIIRQCLRLLRRSERKFSKYAKWAKCELKTLPGMYQLD